MKNPKYEQQVIELIREGLTNKEIADKIHKSLSTVRGRVHMLMKKYECKNRVQLALKSQNPVILGDLDLQVSFRFLCSNAIYRTITHVSRPATPSYGSRACLNLTTNKAENLECNKPVILI